MDFEILPGYEHEDEIRELFSEYTDMLVSEDEAFGAYLVIQNYDEELRDLRAKYGPPCGRLYLARAGGRAAGCIALRRLDGESCEMKRLYVRDEFRGTGLGGLLVRRLISEARDIGYRRMLLDTLPFLTDAIAMYKKYGFYITEPYNNSPLETTIFMRYDLS